MTLDELLANEELRQHEFPVTREKIFLAHAGDCPLPRRVAEAIAEYARQCTGGDQEKFVYPAILESGRKLAARLLNSRPEEIAFVGPTSLALSFIASGLAWRKHANILDLFRRLSLERRSLEGAGGKRGSSPADPHPGTGCHPGHRCHGSGR